MRCFQLVMLSLLALNAPSLSSKVEAATQAKKTDVSTEGGGLQRAPNARRRLASRRHKVPRLPSHPPISATRYWIGGATGTLLGFGIGHAIVKEHKKMGWVFTLGEAGALAIPVVAALVMGAVIWDGKVTASGGELISIWSGFLFTGAALYLGFRGWEIVDLWSRPKVRWKRTIKPSLGVASAAPPLRTPARPAANPSMPLAIPSVTMFDLSL